MVAPLVIAVIVALLALGPVLFIWALNTLFGLGIAITFKTWCAVVILLTATTPQTLRSHKQ